MGKMYYYLILKGKKTMDDVPDELKETVQKLLDEGGASSDV